MNLRSVKTFLKIVRTGSFVAAAEEMNSTLSTVSMQIRGLEKVLDTDLFDREFRPPRLTPIGHQVAEQAQKLVAAEDDLMSLCHKSDELAGLFRIGFIATASVRLLPSFLARARDRTPRADFRFETALSQVLEERVLSGHLEAAVVTASKGSLPGLRYSALTREELVYAIPGTVVGATIEAAEENLPFLQFNPGSGIGKSIEAFQRRRTLRARYNSIVLDSVEAIMECVNQGLGFTVLAKPDVQRYADASVILQGTGSTHLSRDIVMVTRETLDEFTRERILTLFHE